MLGCLTMPRLLARTGVPPVQPASAWAPERARAGGSPTATDLSALRGRRLIALVDCENLAQEPTQGLWMDFRALAHALTRNARSAQLHAFYTEEGGRSARWGAYFRDRGYICHPHPVEFVHGRLRANSDPDLLFNAGRLLPGCGADTLLVASGDGDLVSDIARLARQCDSHMTTIALGLPGKVSSRLSKSRQHVDHCIFAGEDLMHREHAAGNGTQRRSNHRTAGLGKQHSSVML